MVKKGDNMKKAAVPVDNSKFAGPTPPPSRGGAWGQIKKTMPAPVATSSINDELTGLKDAAAVVQQLRISAQRELALAKKMRADAHRYQRETETKARSEAQQLILRARLSTQREIEELIRKASDEIQKILADIRVIRITAQEELAAQRKFTDAAKLCSMSLAMKEDYEKPEVKRKKQVVITK
jgi:hypothetical protein